MKFIRKIQKIGSDSNNSGRVLIPKELGFNPRDIIIIELTNDNTIILSKVK